MPTFYPKIGFLLFFVFGFNAEGKDKNPHDLGQKNIRDRWHEAQQQLSLEKFLSTYYFVDVAENYWSHVLTSTSTTLSEPKDIQASHHYVRLKFVQNPLHPTEWISALKLYLQNWWDRPWDGIHEWVSWFYLFFPPAFGALILILIFYLWLMLPALIQHLSQKGGSSSSLVWFALLFLFFLITFKTSQWAFLCHLLLCLTLIFHRKKGGLLFFSLFTAGWLSFKPLLIIFFNTISLFSVDEALEKGRTRLEYSPTALIHLTPLKKALWADFNGNMEITQYWLSKAPHSKEKEIMLINLQAQHRQNDDLVQKYEALNKKYPNDPVILFNLSQLYWDTQDLSKAERIRNQLGNKNNEILFVRSLMMKKQLLNAIPPIQVWDIGALFMTELQKWTQTLLPLNLGKLLLFIFYFLFPWFMIIGSLKLRKSAPGMCMETGELTTSLQNRHSPLYTSTTEAIHPLIRQKLDPLILSFSRLQKQRISRLSYFLPGAASLVQHQSLSMSWAKTFMTFLFFWLSFSLQFRLLFLETMGCETNFVVPHSLFSWMFLITAFFFHFIFFIESQGKASS